MIATSDILVIGAGMAGCGAAARLAPHARVTVLEMEDRPAYHTTGRSAATFILNYGNAVLRALNAASAMNAYILADRASWLKFGNKGELALLFSGDPTLFNQYAFLPVNPEKHPHVNAAGAGRLEDWLAGDRAKALIDGYALQGERLFTHNAQPKAR